jgi:hypothetical protein
MFRLKVMKVSRGNPRLKNGISAEDRAAGFFLPGFGARLRNVVGEIFLNIRGIFSLLCLTHGLNSDNRLTRPEVTDHIRATGILFGPVAQH